LGQWTLSIKGMKKFGQLPKHLRVGTKQLSSGTRKIVIDYGD